MKWIQIKSIVWNCNTHIVFYIIVVGIYTWLFFYNLGKLNISSNYIDLCVSCCNRDGSIFHLTVINIFLQMKLRIKFLFCTRFYKHSNIFAWHIWHKHQAMRHCQHLLISQKVYGKIFRWLNNGCAWLGTQILFANEFNIMRRNANKTKILLSLNKHSSSIK